MADSSRGAASIESGRRGSPGFGPFFFLTWRISGHVGRRENIFKRLERGENVGGIDVHTASLTELAFPDEQHRDVDFFDPVASFAERFRITKAGVYRCEYNVSVSEDSASGTGSARFIGRKNGSGEISGSLSNVWVDAGASVGSHSDGYARASFMETFAVDDYWGIWHIGFNGTIAIDTVIDRSLATTVLLSQTDEDNSGGVQVAGGDGTLYKIVLMKGVSGTTGTTSIDVHKNGVSILPTQKLDMGPTDQVIEYPFDVFSDLTVSNGDQFTLVVDAEESPFLRDLTAQIWVRRA